MRVVLAVLVAAQISAATATSRAAPSAAFVIASDYAGSGCLSVVDLATRSVSRCVTPVSSDACVRSFGGLVYVVNRFGQDNIQVVDPARGYATVRQFSTGNGSNPQDIAFASATKAYVSCLASASLLVVDPSTGAGLGSISLAEYADRDGLQEAARMRCVGNRLFVALQRLAQFLPTDSSLVAVIDTDADTVIDCDPARPGRQAILLMGTNPVTTFEYDTTSRRLLLGCLGHYGVADGGIEWIDPKGLTAGGWAVTEDSLGGDVLDFAWNGPDHSYAIVGDASGSTSLVSWSAAGGHRIATIHASGGFAPGGFSLARCALDERGELFVCQSLITSPGLFVFSTANDSLLAGPLDTRLPPIDVTFGTPAGGTTNPSRASFAAPWPNPARGTLSCSILLDGDDDVRIQAFDLAGRQVRLVASGRVAGTARTFTWDLKDDRGKRVENGIYLIRAQIGKRSWTYRVAAIR